MVLLLLLLLHTACSRRVRDNDLRDGRALGGLDRPEVEVADLEAIGDEVQVVRVVHRPRQGSFR